MLWRCVKVGGSRFVASYDFISFCIDLCLSFVGEGSLLQFKVIAHPHLNSRHFENGRRGRPFYVKRGLIHGVLI